MPRWRPLATLEGATVALVAPSFALPEGMAALAADRLHALGFQVRPGEHLAGRDGMWAGTVAERAADLAWALTDERVDIVWAARGGEGAQALLPRLPWADIARRPRPFVGMSDLTALHAALGCIGIPSVHGAMPGGDEGWDGFAAAALGSALSAGPGWEVPGPAGAEPPSALRPGVAEGRLLGGNLTMLAALCGGPYLAVPAGAVLLLEEVTESAYRIDRCLVQLRQAGLLDRIAGVALGTFTRCTATNGVEVSEVLERHLLPLGVPVLRGLPLGHGPVQSAAVLGARVRLDAAQGRLTLLESPYAAALVL